MPAAGRAGIAHHPDKPIAAPIMADCLLVVGTVAQALGSAAVSASLVPFPEHGGDATPERPPVVMARVDAPWPGASRDDSPGLPAAPRDLAGDPGSGPRPCVIATCLWGPTLDPQNGISLWDHIRGNSRQDRCAFLLGTAIQIHARAAATTPGSRAVVPPPPCCPRS